MRTTDPVDDLVRCVNALPLSRIRAKVGEAIRVTFDRRGAHAVPNVLSQPPTDWQKPYDAPTKECGLSGAIDSAFGILDTYLSEGGLLKLT
jgi:hypothetical protein